MKKLILFIALACSIATTFNVRAQVPDPNHTVVRFDVFAGGTNFGKIDIELFDQEKPETVRNFLIYVYSGGYSNLVLHRLVPNFVLQAGHIRAEDPTSTNTFSRYPLSPTFGQITNEYGVGPELTNDFGTIAMARLPGQTNSATTDWYINLTNNPFLNTNDGGFTVFGRVVNTMDERSGTNLLNYFNTLSSGNGIRSAFVADPGESLNSLPVTTDRIGSPIYADLFTVRTSFVQGGMPRDDIGPTVQVTQPMDASSVTFDSSLTIVGTATDNQEVARVLYDTSSGKSLVANGKANWSVELALNYGTNRFSVRSVDYFGNVSPVVERVIVRWAPPPDPNHTIVRLAVFTGGTNFGNIDIELFDEQKPETVRNFLLYVYSGGYSNILFHELEPNKILQSGHVQINNPAGTEVFETFDRTPSFGTISNEYSVNSELPNEFGTIALIPRSFYGFSIGSLDWVLNTGNNTSFNTSNGYVVFGRIVNTQDDHGSADLLNFFNTFTYFNNIRGVGLIDANETFNVPVTEYHADRYPKTSEMFLVDAFVLHSGVAPDAVPPTLQVNEPGASVPLTTNSSIRFSGTATDNQAVARVVYDYGLPFRRYLANGKENWTVEVPLDGGTNEISVRSVDYFGNLSPAVERTIFYSLPRRIHFEMVGKGKVTGITNGQSFFVGVNYKLVATPLPGQFFLGWRGGFSSRDRIIYLTMWEDLTNITATFSRTLLGLSNGVYNGLFFPHTNGPSRSAGWISLNLSAKGEYFGRLAPLGANYQIHGKFNSSNGISEIYGQRGPDTLYLRLALHSEAIFGIYFDGHSLSDIELWRAQKFGGTNTPPSGNYTFTISPTMDTNRLVVADGSGFGTVTIDALGKTKMAGTLADETPIRQNSVLLKGNRWPFFASYKGRGGVMGWASFDSNDVFNANVKWFSQNFPGETNQNARLSGSPYTPPSQARLFNWTNGVVTLSGDGLTEPISADVLLNEDGSFTVLSNTNNIQLSVTDATGLLSGSFTHPVSNVTTPLKGAVLQSSNIAAGYFPGTPRDGSLLIRRAP